MIKGKWLLQFKYLPYSQIFTGHWGSWATSWVKGNSYTVEGMVMLFKYTCLGFIMKTINSQVWRGLGMCDYTDFVWNHFFFKVSSYPGVSAGRKELRSGGRKEASENILASKRKTQRHLVAEITPYWKSLSIWGIPDIHFSPTHSIGQGESIYTRKSWSLMVIICAEMIELSREVIKVCSVTCVFRCYYQCFPCWIPQGLVCVL